MGTGNGTYLLIRACPVLRRFGEFKTRLPTSMGAVLGSARDARSVRH
jgi:hypothetical protein